MLKLFRTFASSKKRQVIIKKQIKNKKEENMNYNGTIHEKRFNIEVYKLITNNPHLLTSANSLFDAIADIYYDTHGIPCNDTDKLLSELCYDILIAIEKALLVIDNGEFEIEKIIDYEVTASLQGRTIENLKKDFLN